MIDAFRNAYLMIEFWSRPFWDPTPPAPPPPVVVQTTITIAWGGASKGNKSDTIGRSTCRFFSKCERWLQTTCVQLIICNTMQISRKLEEISERDKTKTKTKTLNVKLSNLWKTIYAWFCSDRSSLYKSAFSLEPDTIFKNINVNRASKWKGGPVHGIYIAMHTY